MSTTSKEELDELLNLQYTAFYKRGTIDGAIEVLQGLKNDLAEFDVDEAVVKIFDKNIAALQEMGDELTLKMRKSLNIENEVIERLND